MKKVVLFIMLSVICPSALSVDLYCGKILESDRPSPHHLFRLNLEEKSGTHFISEHDAYGKLFNVKELPLREMVVDDLWVKFVNDYTEKGAINRQLLQLWTDRLDFCEVIEDFESRLQKLRLEAANNTPERAF